MLRQVDIGGFENGRRDVHEADEIVHRASITNFVGLLSNAGPRVSTSAA
jgi:hypothetical protein